MVAQECLGHLQVVQFGCTGHGDVKHENMHYMGRLWNLSCSHLRQRRRAQRRHWRERASLQRGRRTALKTPRVRGTKTSATIVTFER